MKQAITGIIEAIGDDVNREGLIDTPRRVSEMYAEFFSGMDKDPCDELSTGFEEGHKEMVVLKDIPFFSICEHHFLPFYGTAHVGYVPSGRVVGLSKIARALDVLAKRPQLQERLTTQLVDAINKSLSPQGAAVVISAEHMCMTLRGAKKPGSKIVTSSSRGSLKTVASQKQEFLEMIRGI